MRSKDNTALISVIAAVIRRNATFLICRRPLHKMYGGLWEFPGGKLRTGESILDAARRELAEELQTEVIRTGESLFGARDSGSQFFIEFVEVEIQGEPKAVEHLEIRWCSLEELTELPLAPVDARFVSEQLRKHDS